MNCPNCNKPIPDGSVICPECLTTLPRSAAENTVQPQANEAQPLPMKWYKFLIFFALWAGALLDLFSGVSTLTGMPYTAQGVTPKQVYGYFGAGLHILDVVVGILMIGLAVFAIVVRFRLSGYKKDGPKLLLLLYGVSAVVSLVYTFAAGAITSTNIFETSTVTNLAVSVVMIIVNRIYFQKRSHLFCR
jgi:uncharacterized membrane protein